MRLLLAEVGKLFRPLTAAAALVLILVSIGWATVVRESASQNLGAAESGYRWLLEHPTPCGAGFGVPPGPKCERLQREERQRAEEYLTGVRTSAARVRQAQEGIGAGILAAGMAASVPGALVAIVLGAATAGGEWRSRTIVYLLLQEPRRHRVLLSKVVATWMAGLALLLATWLGLAAASLLLRSIWPLPEPAHTDLASPLLWAGRATVVLLAFASIGVAAGTLTRSATAGTLAGIGALSASLVLSDIEATRSFSFAQWVAAWMGFRLPAASFEIFYLWTSPTEVPGMTAWQGFSALIATILCVGVPAALVFRRAEI